MPQTTDQNIAAAIAAVGTELKPDTPFQQLVDIIFARTLRWIEILLPQPHSNEVLKLFPKLAEPSPKLGTPHFEIFHTAPGSDSFFLPFTKYIGFDNLLRYAESGSGYYVTEKGTDRLCEELNMVEKVFLSFPVVWLESDDEIKAYHHSWLLIGKARARYKLDNEQALTFNDVVLLSGMNEKSVSNATQKRHGSKRLIVDPDNTVKHAHAIAWLLNRKSFIPTIGASYEKQYQAGLDVKDLVFVPVSESGREFLPSSGTTYNKIFLIIDDEGEIHDFDNYFEALEKLMVWEHGAWIEMEGDEFEKVDPRRWARKTKTELLRAEVSILNEADCLFNDEEKEQKIIDESDRIMDLMRSAKYK